jgi:hypothetical protein
MMIGIGTPNNQSKIPRPIDGSSAIVFVSCGRSKRLPEWNIRWSINSYVALEAGPQPWRRLRSVFRALSRCSSSSSDFTVTPICLAGCFDYPPYVKVGIAFRASLLAPGIVTFVSSLFMSR